MFLYLPIILLILGLLSFFITPDVKNDAELKILEADITVSNNPTFWKYFYYILGVLPTLLFIMAIIFSFFHSLSFGIISIGIAFVLFIVIGIVTK